MLENTGKIREFHQRQNVQILKLCQSAIKLANFLFHVFRVGLAWYTIGNNHSAISGVLECHHHYHHHHHHHHHHKVSYHCVISKVMYHFYL